jgi:PAT family beta-lactamase induction signal transducer AmpG
MISLQESKTARVTTLCALYFAQGFPWGFMTTALVAYLAKKGLSVENTGYLISMAVLPWTFKLLWAPLIDSLNYPSMGRRRPWIILSQLMMALTLVGLSFKGNFINNLDTLAWMFFLHNCFASLQDVCTDALAIDIIPDDERGQINGFMWGSKIVGVGFGGSILGTVLVHTSLNITVLFQAFLVICVMIFPLLFRERIGEKLLPWTHGKSMISDHSNTLRNPILIFKDMLKGFSLRPTFTAAVFILTAYIGSGISSAFLPIVYIQKLGWEPDSYSQVLSGLGTIPEFFGALLGGYIADRIGKRKIIAIGYSSYALLTICFGFLSEYWTNSVISTLYLVLHPGCISFGTVAVFSLFMQISWTRAAATMFTSYMAMANLSTTLGTRLAGYIDGIMSYNNVFILVGVFTLLPLSLLIFINPYKMDELKNPIKKV